ncbi:hypothetical protein DI487_08505 [Flavobacterium sediminis]|uniref:DUF3871 domain-containing protein n=1 Tax=Flavobacterium sediminis TaxID=2201181 RepID=A0A2U8QZL9_9FLAO|nr:DUF3871 family protein [Flavobacterium sediminis]AWM15304.1 hypothetical protein DI487_08505 [Flavobacterium sediminis]
MELVTTRQEGIVVEESQIVKSHPKRNFIEANTIQVDINHLKDECIIPVFAKDNETTISHYQFINTTKSAIKEILDYQGDLIPDIRVSHIIKGRVPSAIGKPAKELLEKEKTIYYERMAFLFEIPQISEEVNGNKLNLCIGGVRAYNQENLFSKKSIEKFKVFIGFQNTICTNLCISTDGLLSDLRVSSVEELKKSIIQLVNEYDRKEHLIEMKKLNDFYLSESQFAHLIGKMKLFSHLEKGHKKTLFPLMINDSQINIIVKDYHFDKYFSKKDNKISLWSLYNLFTEANKSTYIDSNLERNVNACEFMKYIGNLLKNNHSNYFLHNNIIAF